MNKGEKIGWILAGIGAFAGTGIGFNAFDRTEIHPLPTTPLTTPVVNNAHKKVVTLLQNGGDSSMVPKINNSLTVTERVDPRVKEKAQVLNQIESDPAIRRHIYGSGWYRDYMNGSIRFEDFKNYVSMVEYIESSIRNPEILKMVQGQEGWDLYQNNSYTPALLTTIGITVRAAEYLLEKKLGDPEKYTRILGQLLDCNQETLCFAVGILNNWYDQ